MRYRLVHWNKIHQTTICILINLLLSFMALPFFLTLQEHILQKELQLKRLSIEKKQQDDMIANLSTLKIKSEQLAVEWQEKSLLYLDKENLHTASSRIEAIAKQANVHIIDMDTTNDITSIKIIGHYTQHLIFIHAISEVPYLLLHDLQVKPYQNEWLQMVLHIQILLSE